MLPNLKKLEVWFVTGSQHLYGSETLKTVAEHSKEIAAFFNKSSKIPVSVVFKPVMTGPDEIANICIEANTVKNCIGVITWCHTFSPSKMWINGLKVLQKPILHLHTQFNRDLPWGQIDMDFMNLNQSAHGDREHGFIMARMRIERKVVVGHWKENEVQERIGVWARAAAAWADFQGAKIARFGDNMREVAVTEGDKVEAQIKFGLSVNTYGVGDIVKVINEVPESDIDDLVKEYADLYQIASAGKPGARSIKTSGIRRALSLASKGSSNRAGLKDSPPPSKTFTDWSSSQDWPRSGSWPPDTASAPRATGNMPRLCVRLRSWALV